MISVIIFAFATLLCYASLVAGAKADESAEVQYQDYLKKQALSNQQD